MMRGATERRQPFLPYLAVGVGVVAISFSAIFIRWAEAPPAVIAFYRMLFSTLMLMPVALLRYRRDLTGLGWKGLAAGILAGLLLAAHFYAFITSLSYTSVASSVVLVTAQPLFVALGAYLLYGERLPRDSIPGVILALMGALLIGVGDLALSWAHGLGDLLAIGGAVLLAGYFLIGKGLRRHLEVVPYTFMVYGTCTLALFLLVVLTGGPLYPYPRATWGLFLLMAVVPTILGHTLFNWAIGYLPVMVVSMAFLLEPVGSGFLAWVLLGEELIWTGWLGGIAVLGGLYWFMRRSRWGN